MITLSRLDGNTSATTATARTPFTPIAPAAVHWLRHVFDINALLILAPFSLATMSTWRRWSQMRNADIVHIAPQLGADLIQLRAYSHHIIGEIELQTTLKIGVVHGAWR